MNVSCVIPTRGNVDLTEILESLAWCDDVIVWNNAEREDLGIYGRYAAIAEAKHDVIITQDDDLVVTGWPQLLAEYEPGVLTVNYPQPWDIPWVARGAIFDRDLPEQAFALYFGSFDMDKDFTHWMCDGIFALLTPHRAVDYGSRDLSWCNDAGRVSSDAAEWYQSRRQWIKSRCEAVAA